MLISTCLVCYDDYDGDGNDDDYDDDDNDDDYDGDDNDDDDDCFDLDLSDCLVCGDALRLQLNSGKRPIIALLSYICYSILYIHILLFVCLFSGPATEDKHFLWIFISSVYT